MIRDCNWLHTIFFTTLVGFGLGLTGYSSTSGAASENQQQNESSKAISNLNATTGNAASGRVYFVTTENGVRISAQLLGLTPGDHGFHIHKKGDCSSGDGKSAGGHFNPHKVSHGGPDAAIRHVGDLGNITANAEGNASYDRIDSLVSFTGPNSIIGKGIIIHAGADDLTSQPTGAAGARVACGVIEAGS